VSAVPWMVKPNIHELSSLCNRELASDNDIVDAAGALQGTGIETVLVTSGSRGAFAVNRAGVLRSSPPPVHFVSAVGSGDAFLAGYIWALGARRSHEKCLKIATAAGAANAATFGSCFISSEEVYRLAQKVRIEVLN